MKTVAELLEELNQIDDKITVEAKSASDVGRSLLETVYAFANEPNLGGGHVLLGVVQAEQSFWPTYRVIGLKDPDRIQSQIASQCATAFNIPIRGVRTTIWWSSIRTGVGRASTTKSSPTLSFGRFLQPSTRRTSLGFATGSFFTRREDR